MYVEPYAGGAAVALQMLLGKHVPRVWINDFDSSIFAFWNAVKEEPAELCRRIANATLTISEWHRQRGVRLAGSPDPLDLAFSTFFLNRTSRSGILMGGLIGGQHQNGRWKLSARFNKKDLICRIEAIAKEGNRLLVTGEDAAKLIARIDEDKMRAFLFLDPPYFHKFDRRLYRDDYGPDDHRRIANTLRSIDAPWLLSYDDCAEIHELYAEMQKLSYLPSYTAGNKRLGAELIIAAPMTDLPDLVRPRAHSIS